MLKGIDFKKIAVRTVGGTVGMLAAKYALNNFLANMDEKIKPLILLGVGVGVEMITAKQKGMIKDVAEAASFAMLTGGGELAMQTFAPEIYSKIVPMLTAADTDSAGKALPFATASIGFNPGVALPDNRGANVLGVGASDEIYMDDATGKYYAVNEMGELKEVTPSMNGTLSENDRNQNVI